MKGTRKEWIEKARAATFGLPQVTLERFADLAEEHGGPFEPEPPAVEVVWESEYHQYRLMSSGQWFSGNGNGGWWRETEDTEIRRELARRLLAEWRAKQGPGDWADAAAREWGSRPKDSAGHRGTEGDLSAIFRRHAEPLTDQLHAAQATADEGLEIIGELAAAIAVVLSERAPTPCSKDCRTPHLSPTARAKVNAALEYLHDTAAKLEAPEGETRTSRDRTVRFVRATAAGERSDVARSAFWNLADAFERGEHLK